MSQHPTCANAVPCKLLMMYTSASTTISSVLLYPCAPCLQYISLGGSRLRISVDSVRQVRHRPLRSFIANGACGRSLPQRRSVVSAPHAIAFHTLSRLLHPIFETCVQVYKNRVASRLSFRIVVCMGVRFVVSSVLLARHNGLDSRASRSLCASR